MFLSFQYRIYPLRTQEAALDHFLRELNYLWNHSLAQRHDARFRERDRVTYLDQQARLKHWRAFDFQGLGAVPFDCARDCLQRLDLAYRASFRRPQEGRTKFGFPRFRRETRSFTFIPPPDLMLPARAGTWRLHIPLVGPVPIRRHRPSPPEATAKSVTVSRVADGWYATIQYQIPDPPPPPPTEPLAPVGIDFGLSPLATLSTGESVARPRFLRESERTLARAQRRLSRKQQGSHRSLRQKDRLARAHARVRRQRRGFAHQLSHDWTERFDLVAFEDMDIAAFSEGNRLAKGMADAGWGLLRQLTRYKAALSSGRCVEIPSRGTTQTCAECARLADPPLTLSDRRFRCPVGHEADREVNAAQNVLARGLKEVRRNTAELTRVEGTPPPTRRGRRAYLRKRELANGRVGAGRTLRRVPRVDRPEP